MKAYFYAIGLGMALLFTPTAWGWDNHPYTVEPRTVEIGYADVYVNGPVADRTYYRSYRGYPYYRGQPEIIIRPRNFYFRYPTYRHYYYRSPRYYGYYPPHYYRYSPRTYYYDYPHRDRFSFDLRIR